MAGTLGGLQSLPVITRPAPEARQQVTTVMGMVAVKVAVAEC